MRFKQETRALSVASSQSSLSSSKQAAERTRTEEKPPLGPSELRLPLHGITNFLPLPSPDQNHKAAITAASVSLSSIQDKENAPLHLEQTQSLMKPRHMSVGVGPAPPPLMLTQGIQPRRQMSIATLCPETNSNLTPLYTSASHLSNGPTLRDQRKARYSKLFSPFPEFRTAAPDTPITTPIATRSGSKFMDSPTQPGSWKPRHPAVVALQRKSLVWSPLNYRSVKNYRKSSLLPSRPSGDMQ